MLYKEEKEARIRSMADEYKKYFTVARILAIKNYRIF